MNRPEKGIYEQVVNQNLSKLKDEATDLKIYEDQMDPAESSSYLSRYVQKVLESGLIRLRENHKADSLDKQIELCNDILTQISDRTESENPSDN